MFYGRSPCRYGGQTAPQVFHAFLERAPDDERLPVIPDPLARLIKRCFRRSTDARPQSMRDVAEELIEVYRQVTGNEYRRREPARTELMANSLIVRHAAHIIAILSG